VSHRLRNKAESDKEAVAPGHGTVRAICSAGKTNIGVKRGFPRDYSQTGLFDEVPALSVARPHCSTQGQAAMKWASVDVDFRGAARVSMGTPFPRKTFIWKRSCGTIAGLNAQTGILGGKLIAGGGEAHWQRS